MEDGAPPVGIFLTATTGQPRQTVPLPRGTFGPYFVCLTRSPKAVYKGWRGQMVRDIMRPLCPFSGLSDAPHAAQSNLFRS